MTPFNFTGGKEAAAGETDGARGPRTPPGGIGQFVPALLDE